MVHKQTSNTTIIALNAINDTIIALNDGSKEAMADAYNIKQDVIKTGNKDLIKYIEYLWEVI